jgi:hypothetical protein
LRKTNSVKKLARPSLWATSVDENVIAMAVASSSFTNNDPYQLLQKSKRKVSQKEEVPEDVYLGVVNGFKDLK